MASAQTATPGIAGYALNRVPDLTDSNVREKISGSAIQAFEKIAKLWDLTEAQARGLLGGIASSTFHAWRSEPDKQKLTQDTLFRISLVLGIYQALNVYFGEPWANQWVTLGNRGSMFAGAAPIDYMIREGQPGMFDVRRMLDSWSIGH
ncbi:MAG: antitoxin Xre-like helix-turn-helix domain-containing protein [Bryobacteraceae bacterium]